MVQISCTYYATWTRIVGAKRRGLQQRRGLLATISDAEKAAPTLPLPRKQLPSCTERGFAQGFGCCCILRLAVFSSLT